MAKRRSWWTAALHRVGLAQVSDGITKAEFLAACEQESFRAEMHKTLAPLMRAQLPGVAEPTPEQLFGLIDVNGDGVLDLKELQRLVLFVFFIAPFHYHVRSGRLLLMHNPNFNATSAD